MYPDDMYLKSGKAWECEVIFMKNRYLVRMLLGVLISIVVSVICRICVSIKIGDGNFHPVPPEFASIMGSELNAVLVQLLLFVILGVVCGIATYIFEQENLGIIIQYGIYLTISCAMIFLVFYITFWVEHSVKGVVLFFISYVSSYVLGCAILYNMVQSRVKKMNKRIEEYNITR